MDIDELQEKYGILIKQVGELRERLNNALNEIDAKEAELKKKADLCTMYEHILDERGSQLDDLAGCHEADTAKIAGLNVTIDVLAARIAELSDGKGGR